MPFVISFALSLLALTAGLFLLIKARQDTWKFLKIMSWIIISCGILAVLLSLHFAIMKHIIRHNEDFSNENYFFYKDKLPFQKYLKFEDIDEDLPFGDEGQGEVKVIVKKESSDDAADPDVQAEKIIKIITDNIKLTAEQEQKIKDEMKKSLDTDNSSDKKDDTK